MKEAERKRVRMANLACVGSRVPSTASPNCIPAAERKTVLRDFHDLWPEKFNNKTNGVTPRRFLQHR